MTVAKLECTHCAHPFKISYIVKPSSVRCPKCKRLGPLSPAAAGQQSSGDVATAKNQTVAPTAQGAREAELRKIIWCEVAPTNMAFADEEAITKLGDEGVPIIIDIFTNPRCPTTGVACNQAVLAYTLTVAARRGNAVATDFLRKIVAGQINLYDTWGQSAFNLAKECLSQLHQESEADAEQPETSTAGYTFDDAIRRAKDDASRAPFASDKVRLGDLATHLAGIKSGRDNVNLKDGNGWTALTAAARFGHEKTVELLISKGAKVNAEGYVGGVTALMSAATNGHLETVKVLLSNGADVNARNREGQTALNLAEGCHHDNVAEVLREHRAKEQ